VRLGLLACAVLAAATAGPLAHAKPRPGEAAETSKEAQARPYYEHGIKLYQIGDFDGAIAEFKHAYEINDNPALLFNLAQACRQKHDYEQALFHYRTYLRLLPDAKNRSLVEDRIAELEKRVRDEPQVTPNPPVVAPPVVTPALSHDGRQSAPGALPPLAPGPAPPGLSPDHDAAALRLERRIALVSGAGGVGMLGLAVYFGVKSRSAADDITHLSQSGGTWSAAEQQKYDDGRTAAHVSTALFIVGGLATAAGGALYGWSWMRDRRAQSNVAVTPLLGGGALVARCRF
jgi:tetratricopeptide (TPR) repeat protein